MEKEEARKLAAAKLEASGFGKYAGLMPTAQAETLPAGSWHFVVIDAEIYVSVVVRGDTKQAYCVQGANGRTWRAQKELLGLPTSDEGLVASSFYARYQTFEGGPAIWEFERAPGGGELEHGSLPRFGVDSIEDVQIIAATFDLRGSTAWAEGKDISEVRVLVGRLEEAVQSALHSDPLAHRVGGLPFLKGTGDGVLLVVESRSMDGALATRVLAVCRRALDLYRPHGASVSVPLGCGLDIGKARRFVLYGRPDYMSDAINQSAKLQALAWDEIVVTNAFHAALPEDAQTQLSWKRLERKGWRLL